MAKEKEKLRPLARSIYESEFFQAFSPEMKCAFEYIYYRSSGVGTMVINMPVMSFWITGEDPRKITLQDLKQGLGENLIWLDEREVFMPCVFPSCWPKANVKNKSVRGMMREYVSYSKQTALPSRYRLFAEQCCLDLEQFDLKSNLEAEEGRVSTESRSSLSIKYLELSNKKEEEEKLTKTVYPVSSDRLERFARRTGVKFQDLIRKFPMRGSDDLGEAFIRLDRQWSDLVFKTSFLTALDKYAAACQSGDVPEKYRFKFENWIGENRDSSPWYTQWLKYEKAVDYDELAEQVLTIVSEEDFSPGFTKQRLEAADVYQNILPRWNDWLQEIRTKNWKFVKPALIKALKKPSQTSQKPSRALPEGSDSREPVKSNLGGPGSLPGPSQPEPVKAEDTAALEVEELTDTALRVFPAFQHLIKIKTVNQAVGRT